MGWKSMSAHKKVVCSELYQFKDILPACPMQSLSISSAFAVALPAGAVQLRNGSARRTRG